MKKHRGLKRYYKNLAVKNDLYIVGIATLNTAAGFNNQHLHFDKWGYGNLSFKRRKPHLDKLFRHFDLLTEQTTNLTDFQLYAVILDYNSASDALFLQKPTHDNWPFLFKLEDLSTTSTLTNVAINEYITNLEGY